MDNTDTYYDAAIVGGGLAGLATAIQLAKAGFKVILFEKEVYPFHKVCGEYISFESWDFLLSLGVPVDRWKLPAMDTLQLSAPNGNQLLQKLPLGGFGVSRFLIDSEMAQLAKNQGAVIMDGTKVQAIQFSGNRFSITTDHAVVQANVCCGTSGKRSNLDVKWKRPFVQQRPGALNNFIGVKYHVRLDHPKNIIALHNFKKGYCGVAAIEDDKVNLCYLTTAQNLRNNGNNIQFMEADILFKNPLLKEIFAKAEFLHEKPVTISQISFNAKEQVRDHILFIGDAAGMITPLCGNGMSMALHSSRIAFKCMLRYLQNTIDRSEMEVLYEKEWKVNFSSRLRTGRLIQGLFGSEWLTSAVVNVLKPLPFLTRSIIRRTHG